MTPSNSHTRQRFRSGPVTRSDGSPASSGQCFRTFGRSATSNGICNLEATLHRIAVYTPHTLISGESGAGKEEVAKRLHTLAFPGQEQPFIAVNCGALSEALLESELFGHERGAFTGAVKTSRGVFEQAGGGTLFLDEVAHPEASRVWGAAARESLVHHPWPGNVRELKHCIERAWIMSRGPALECGDLSRGLRSVTAGRDARDSNLKTYLRGCEREHIVGLLERNDWVIGRSAEELGISRKNLWERMRRLGIDALP